MSRHGIKRKHDEAACDRHSYVHNSGCVVCDTWVNHDVIADYRAKYGTPPRAARLVCTVAHPDAPLPSACEVPVMPQRGAPRDMRIPGREWLHTMAAWRAWFYPKPGRLGERARERRHRRRTRAASRRAVMRAHRAVCSHLRARARRFNVPLGLIRVEVAPMRPEYDYLHYEKFLEVWAVLEDGWCEVGTWRAGR